MSGVAWTPRNIVFVEKINVFANTGVGNFLFIMSCYSHSAVIKNILFLVYLQLNSFHNFSFWEADIKYELGQTKENLSPMVGLVGGWGGVGILGRIRGIYVQCAFSFFIKFPSMLFCHVYSFSKKHKIWQGWPWWCSNKIL